MGSCMMACPVREGLPNWFHHSRCGFRVDDFYFDREQSQAKHDILRRYLEPFAIKILSSWQNIDFIDGFSGPWKNIDTDNLTDTSIGIALSTLSGVAEQMGHTRSDRRIRCIFNEANPKAYAHMKAYIDRSRDDFPLLKVQTFEGKFEDNAPKICHAANHRFQLLFVDPTGYTGFPPSSLTLFNGRSSEIIVNFMRSFIERFVSGDHEDKKNALIGLVGEKRAHHLLETGLTIETVEDEYLKMLRGDLGYEFAGYSPIHNPDKNEIHFNLAYGTNHLAGMEVMRNAEFFALTDHDRRRFKKSVASKGDDLFGNMLDEMEIMGPYLRLRKDHRQRASEVLLQLVSENRAGLKFSELVAMAQQSLYLKRSELGDVIVEMADSKLVRATWLDRGGRKPGPDDLIIAS